LKRLGKNGAGKSTLLKIMAGVDPDFDGIAVPRANARIGYLAQMPTLVGETVQDAIDDAVRDTKDLLDQYSALSSKIGDESLDADEREKLSNQWARLQDEIDAKDGWELDRNIDRALDALQCPPNNARNADLSGGETRRVALCALLLRRPDLLILDEPTNHLDCSSVLWLERFLETFQGTVVCVTHDRYFLDRITQWILSLADGKGVPFEGNYTAYLGMKSRELEQSQKAESSIRRQINAELDWIRASPKGRQTKSKSRVSRFDDLVDEQKRFTSSRAFSLDKLYIPPGPLLGDIVVEADNVSKSFNGRVLFEKLNFSLPRGGIVGVVGPNGYGKSTLLKMITGEEKPDSGTLKVGETVKLMYVNQERDFVDRNQTVFQAVANGNDELILGERSISSRAYLSWFNFRGGDQQKMVSNLSGGELSRLTLAAVFKQGGNVLLCDEITNDADTNLIAACEDAILDFAGCVVTVSHDRCFLDRVCTHILSFEEETGPRFYEGNYSAYDEDKRRRIGDTTPSRVKFAKLPAL
jgi:energy-dependent translational throttle protein EttA